MSAPEDCHKCGSTEVEVEPWIWNKEDDIWLLRCKKCAWTGLVKEIIKVDDRHFAELEEENK